MTTTNPYAPPRAAVDDVLSAEDEAALPAERGARLGAAILDGIIFTVMVYLPFLFTIAMADSSAKAGGSGASAMVMIGGLLTLAGVIAWCWLTIVYVQRNGQSIAKKLLKIKVVRSDGSRTSLSRIFWLRNVVNALISIIPLYGLIDILFIFGERRQCLHDKIADTIVIKD